MILGFAIKKINLINDVTVKQVNNVIFRVLLPVMLFKNIYESDINKAFNPRLVIYAVVTIVIIIIALFIIIPIIEKDNKKRGALIQGIFRSNFAILGLPVTESLLSQSIISESAAAGIATVSVLIAVIVPLYNFAAVITLEIFNSKKFQFMKMLKNIITNPLIIASVLGIVISSLNITFPSVIESSIKSISSITTPLALVVLGASIQFKTIAGNIKQILIGIIGKLIIVPALGIFIGAYVFNFTGVELIALLALFASPAAVSSFTMAQQMGSDADLAGQLVMISTAGCVFTVFMWIYIIIEVGLL